MRIFYESQTNKAVEKKTIFKLKSVQQNKTVTCNKGIETFWRTVKFKMSNKFN